MIQKTSETPIGHEPQVSWVHDTSWQAIVVQRLRNSRGVLPGWGGVHIPSLLMKPWTTYTTRQLQPLDAELEKGALQRCAFGQVGQLYEHAVSNDLRRFSVHMQCIWIPFHKHHQVLALRFYESVHVLGWTATRPVLTTPLGPLHPGWTGHKCFFKLVEIYHGNYQLTFLIHKIRV